MATKKIRFSVIDFIIIIAVVLVVISAVFRSINVGIFGENNSVSEAVITLSVKGVDRDNFSYFSVGDTIYGSADEKIGKIGNVTSIRSAPAVVPESSEEGHRLEPSFDKVDITMELSAKCLVDEHGFFSIGGVYVAPAKTFEADNGEIKFTCEVISVKTLEK